MATKDRLALSSNLEDYLEAIFHLQAENRVARAKDIAERLSVSRASVSGALKTLAERRLIHYSPYSFITLTDQGETVARQVIERHCTLRDFFENFLRLDPELAEANACRMEHAIDAQVLERLIQFLEFVRHCPRGGADWLEAFHDVCRRDLETDPAQCRACLEDCLVKLPAAEKNQTH
jgi:DtxR family Mn-dependent transcriptional regulator